MLFEPRRLTLPPVFTFYNHPASIEDMARHIVGKVLDVFGLELPQLQRWGQADSEEMIV